MSFAFFFLLSDLLEQHLHTSIHSGQFKSYLLAFFLQWLNVPINVRNGLVDKNPV